MNPKEERKASRELVFLRNFMSFEHLDASLLRHGNPRTEPDFVLRISNKEVGIELTELFRDRALSQSASILKRNEVFRQCALDELSSRYYQISEIPLFVRVFSETFNPESFDVARLKKFAQSLTDQQTESFSLS